MTPLNRGRVQKENWHIVISTYGVLSRLKASPSPTALITAVDDQGAGLCPCRGQPLFYLVHNGMLRRGVERCFVRFLKRLSPAARWSFHMRAFSFAERSSHSPGPS